MYQRLAGGRSSKAAWPRESLYASRKAIAGAVLAGCENPGKCSGQGRFVERCVHAEPAEIKQPMISDILAHDSPPMLVRIISGVLLSSITFIITYYAPIVERDGTRSRQ